MIGTGRIWDLSLSPDGKALAVAGSAGITIYRTDTFEWVRTFGVFSHRVTSVAFAPDGTTLVSGSCDGPVILWDVETGDQVRVLGNHTDEASGIVLSPDGTKLVSAAIGGPAILWDLATRKWTTLYDGRLSTGWHDVAFSPDGTVLAMLETPGGIATLWDVATGEQVRALDDEGVNEQLLLFGTRGVAFSPDGTVLAVQFFRGPVLLWDVATGKLIRTLGDLSVGNGSQAMAFSPDGTMLAAGSPDGNGTTLVWHTTTGKLLHTLTPHLRHTVRVVFSPDSKTLITGQSAGNVIFWDLATGELSHVFGGHTGEVLSVGFSPEGATLASAAGNSLAYDRVLSSRSFTGYGAATYLRWNAATGQPYEMRADSDYSVTSAALSLDTSVLALGAETGVILVWDVAAGKKEWVLKGHTDTVYAVAFSPDGTTLASGSLDGTVVLWDLGTGQPLRTLGGYDEYGVMLALAFSPDGNTLVAGTGMKGAVLWNVATGEPLTAVDVYKDTVTLVAYSPDGRTVASARTSSGVALWVPEAGVCRFGSRPGITFSSMTFSHDGRMLALGGYESVAVLEVATCKQVYRLAGHPRTWYRSVAFSPDGATLAAGTDERAIALWRIGELAVLPRLTPRAPDISFPSQKSVQQPGTSAPDELIGTLRLENGCLRVESLRGEETVLPIWPPEFVLQVDEGQIQVIDGEEKVVARVDQEVYVTGRRGPVEDEWVLQQIPPACQGPYTLVQTVRPNLRRDTNLISIDVYGRPAHRLLFPRYEQALDAEAEDAEPIAGRLVLYEDDRCMRLQTDERPEPLILLWTSQMSPRVGPGEVTIMDGAGQPVARVGDEILVYGRQVPRASESDIYRRLVDVLPGDCCCDSWLVDGIE